MKARPILFSGPMIRALLDGRKTQTRRAVGPLTADRIEHSPGFAEDAVQVCPYGVAGDLLWCRETFYAWGRWETRFDPKKGRDAWHFVDMTLESGQAYEYDAPAAYLVGTAQRGSRTPTWWKRPAIFMPQAASRLTLRLTDVRVQRLQEISTQDAAEEGIDADSEAFDMGSRYQSAGSPMSAERYAFRDLWDSINGAGAWAANPWVWALTFEVIAKNVDQVIREAA